MFELLFNFFSSLLNGFSISENGDILNDIQVSLGGSGELISTHYIYNNAGDIISITQNSSTTNELWIGLGDYLATTLSLISLIIIVVLCCLFIGKLIRVVGRLFMGA